MKRANLSSLLFKSLFIALLICPNGQKAWSQINATVAGGACAGSFMLNANGTANGQNKFSGTVMITVAPFPPQNVPVDLAWSGTQWQIIGAAPAGLVFYNTTATSPNPPCYNNGTWTASGGCIGGSFTASSGDCVPIPIELLSFAAQNDGKANRLTWQTATEIQNKGFDIERSNDGKAWQTLDFVAAKGNNATYIFADNDPLSMSYYRLRQLDYGGQFTLSKTVVVQATRLKSSIKIFPNPVFTEGVIQIGGLTGERTAVSLLNTFGQVVLKEHFNTPRVSIPLKNRLAAGVYFLWIETEETALSQKIIVE